MKSSHKIRFQLFLYSIKTNNFRGQLVYSLCAVGKEQKVCLIKLLLIGSFVYYEVERVEGRWPHG